MKREFTLEGAYHYNRSSPIKWVISHASRYKLFLTVFIIGTAITDLSVSFIPRITGTAFNEVSAGTATVERLAQLALAALGLVVLRGVLDVASSFSVEFLAQRLERDAREELYISLLGKSQTFHNRQRVGDIMARAANDVRQLNGMMNPAVILIYSSVIQIVAPIVMIGTINPQLMTVPIIYAALFAITLRGYVKQLNPVSNSMRRQFGSMNATLAESIGGIDVVKSAVQEPAELVKLIKEARIFRDYFVKHGEIQARYIPTLVLSVALAAQFAHGALLFSRQQLLVGDLVAVVTLTALLRFPTFISTFTFTLLQNGLAGARRILDLINQETELDENESGFSGTMEGRVEFRNVTFAYGDKPVLENASFIVEPGQSVAIVGQTGSGKSTITKLVNRTYDITKGSILVDGRDVREWNLSSLRSQVSTIEQDVFLFSRPLRENIAFGMGQDVTEEQIERAAKQARAHTFISETADGYDTVVGERGMTLSGGQRQRIAIARALITDPKILVLDDSTSAIDSATEDEIQGAIRQVMKGRTTLIITHRLSQIRWADKALIVSDGKISAEGTHEELLAHNKLYQRIFRRKSLKADASDETMGAGD